MQTFPLSESECVKIGGHCYRTSDAVVATNPPIYHRVCKHCGKTQQSDMQVQWVDDY